MRALIQDRYGGADVLELTDVPVPAIRDGEVLVRVRAASLNAADVEYLRGDTIVRIAGPRRPPHRIPGSDVAGVVVEVGPDVADLALGDEVFGDVFTSGFGAFAQFVAAPASSLTIKPANLTFEQAAAVPTAALTALQALRDRGKLGPGQRVLINGASGGVGTFAVQIAKAFGAEVTGVCSTTKMDLVRSLGADRIIDYTRDDITEKGQKYDLIFDVAAFRSILKYRRILSSGGIYVLAGGSMARIFQLMGASMTGAKNMKLIVAKVSQKDLLSLIDLIGAGKVRPIIDRRYPLAETAEALRYLEEGHARGKVVITV